MKKTKSFSRVDPASRSTSFSRRFQQSLKMPEQRQAASANEAVKIKIRPSGKLIALILIFACAFLTNSVHAREPISLDLINADRNRDLSLKPYMHGLRLCIQNYWLPTDLNKTLKVSLHFDVKGDGEIINTKVVQSSGQSRFDQSAISAIIQASPLIPPPQPEGLKIEACFDNHFLKPEQVISAHRQQQLVSQSAPSQATTRDRSSRNENAQGEYNDLQANSLLSKYGQFSGLQSQPHPSYTQPPVEILPPLQSLQDPSQWQKQSYALPAGTAAPSFNQPSTNFGQQFTNSQTFQQTPAGRALTSGVPARPAAPSQYSQPNPSKLQPSRPLQIPAEWLTSGRNGTHHIEKVTHGGYFLVLDDGSVWKSEDEFESDGWSNGDEVFVNSDTIINLSHSSEKIEVTCEERACHIFADTYVKDEFEGSEKPIVLENGMIFEASTYHYQYAYRPEAIVLVCRYKGVILYKVIIDEEIYSVNRLR